MDIRWNTDPHRHTSFTEHIIEQITASSPSADAISVTRATAPSHPSTPDRHDALIIVATNPLLETVTDDIAAMYGDGRSLVIGVVDEIDLRVAHGVYDLETLRIFANDLIAMIDRQERRAARVAIQRASEDLAPDAPPPQIRVRPLWERQLDGTAE